MRALAFLLCLLSAQAWATDWYARPNSACANNGNGAAYACAASAGAAGAWRGLNNVQWGAGKVDSGDTLRVCSTSAAPFVAADADLATGLLSVDQAGAIVDGDCSSQGGGSVAYFYGAGTFDAAVRCDSPNCTGQTWKNLVATDFDIRGFYFRNGFSAAATGNFTGYNLRCERILGTDGNSPMCIQGWGSGSTISYAYSVQTTDDAYQWQGDNLRFTDSYCKDPNYNTAANSGDCLQVDTAPDNAYIARNTFDKSSIVNTSGDTGKQAIALTTPGSSDNALIEDNILLLPLTGNTTNQAKVVYSAVPGTIARRNYVRGGYFGLFLEGAGSTANSNIVVKPEYRGITTSSAVTSGTHSVYNNSVYGPGTTCFDLNGGASVTVNAYNNFALGCTIGYNKGASNTVNQSNNAGYSNATNSFIGTLAVTADPKLVGGTSPTTPEGFCLESDSPLLAAGTYLGAWVTGYAGKDLGKPPAIGARGLCNARAAAAHRASATRQ